MIEVSISIPLPAISINRWTGASKRFISSEARNWIQNVQHALSGPQTQQQLALLRDSFKPKKHSFLVSLAFVVPEKDFYNKQGLYSSRTCDLSNVEKPIIDLLFLERHETAGYKNISWDDKYISELFSTKKSGSFYEIRIKICIFNRC